jgi:vacuolar protein-sorting-associated protein 4
MDGVKAVQDGVLLLAATNIPWNLDTAILRRFQRKVHIGLPDPASRAELFKLAIKSTETELDREDYHRLADMSDNFSGSDISIAVQKALMRPIRLVMEATHFKWVEPPSQTGAEGWPAQRKLSPCSPGDDGALEMTYNDVEGDDLLPPTVRLQDFINAVKETKPSVTQGDKDRHNEWTEQYGTEGAV